MRADVFCFRLERILFVEMIEHPNHLPITSCWSTALPDQYCRIGISRGRPRRQSGYRVCTPLVPGSWWNTVTLEQFYQLYFEQLSRLNPNKVLADICALAGDRVPVLLCYEQLEDMEAFCHRAFVSEWFKATLDIDVTEFGASPNQVGCNHPKFPPGLRRSSTIGPVNFASRARA